jgi:curved DNA-binding protein CbpA
VSLYDDLGVPKDATAAEIKRAHRQRVRNLHPDAGGDREQFDRVQQAYAVLIDATKRERYDRVGDGEDYENQRLDHVAQIIQKAFDEAVAASMHSLERVDVVASMRSNISKERTANRQQMSQVMQLKSSLQTCIARLRHNGAGADIIHHVLAGRLKETERQIELIKLRESHIKDALEFATRYSWETDSPASFTSFGGGSSSTTWTMR